MLSLLAVIVGSLFLAACTIVRPVHTGAGQPTSYYINCYGDVGVCFERALELCPSGYNVTTMAVGGSRHAVIVACQARDVPLA